MRKALLLLTILLAVAASAAESPIDRWAAAIGGREKIATVKALYREGTLDFGGMPFTIAYKGEVTAEQIKMQGDAAGMPFELLLKKTK